MHDMRRLCRMKTWKGVTNAVALHVTVKHLTLSTADMLSNDSVLDIIISTENVLIYLILRIIPLDAVLLQHHPSTDKRKPRQR